ncbi:MAG: hypothetical protein IIA65_00115 [Planctomycetes bacterium]|nr:hypothetical protein [Planctomycetota bacterium]
MRPLLCIIGGSLFLAAFAGHVYVRWRMRPSEDWAEYAPEFEEQHRGYARYLKWYRMTLCVASAGALLLFVALAL